jgi:hypothetical protein
MRFQLFGARRPRIQGMPHRNLPMPVLLEQVRAGTFFGVAKGLSHKDHIEAKAYLSNSGMGPLLESVEAYQDYLSTPPATTSYQNFGTAHHSMTLERAMDRVVVVPSLEDFAGERQTVDDLKARCRNLGLAVSGTKGALSARIQELDPSHVLWEEIYAKFLARFRAQHPGKSLVTQKEHVNLIGMMKAVHAHPEASLALTGGMAETSIFWKQGRVKCKGRLDYLKIVSRELNDLKTTYDASPEGFVRSAEEFGYFRQGAVYVAGVEAVFGFRPEFKIVAVEKKYPWTVRVHRLTASQIEQGHEQFERAIRIYTRCSETSEVGEWAAYAA